MAIIGLTDRKPEYPQIGALRKGGKKTDPKKPGPDLTYFRFDSPDTAASAAFTQVYGKEPVSIRVILPFDELDDNFDAWKEEYTAGALKHRCDGQTMNQWMQKDGTYSFDPKPCTGGCKPTGRLKVIIPDLGRMAIVMVLTTSIHDIMNIHANLRAMQEASGSLRRIPLTLRRVPKQISTPSGDGKRARREKWLIQIEPETDWVQLQLQAQRDRALAGIAGALPPASQLALNAAPEDLDDEEDDVIEGEAVEKPDKEAIESIASATQIRAIWFDMGGTEETWKAYFAKYLNGQSAEIARQRLAEVKAKAEKAKAAQPTPDDVLASIEREYQWMTDAGMVGEVDAEIGRINGGEVVEFFQLDAEKLPELLTVMLEMRAKIETRATKAKA